MPPMHAYKKYQKEHKAYTDRQCQLRLKESEDYVDKSIEYMGCIANALCLMIDVAANWLQLGQNS